MLASAALARGSKVPTYVFVAGAAVALAFSGVTVIASNQCPAVDVVILLPQRYCLTATSALTNGEITYSVNNCPIPTAFTCSVTGQAPGCPNGTTFATPLKFTASASGNIDDIVFTVFKADGSFSKSTTATSTVRRF